MPCLRGFAIVIGAQRHGAGAATGGGAWGIRCCGGCCPLPGWCLWGLWFAMRRNWRDRSVLEEMHMEPRGRASAPLNPRGPVQEWHADPHWVALNMIPKGGPVGKYLTLTGGGREVELGAFLTPDERWPCMRPDPPAAGT
jgi:uncharacterized membrane protein